MEQAKLLASKKPLKCYKKEIDRLVNNKNVIMLYNVDLEGKVYFELAEILDRKTGEYKMLKTGEVRKYLPFVGKKEDNDYEYEETYYEFGEQTFTHYGIDYEIIDRQDNIAFVKLHHMYLDRISPMYSLRDYFHKRACENKGTKVYYADRITFGKDPNKRYSFSAIIYDKNNLFVKNESPCSDWLNLEKEINQLYNRYKHVGKNYIKSDEEVIEKQEKVYQKELKDLSDLIYNEMEKHLGSKYAKKQEEVEKNFE